MLQNIDKKEELITLMKVHDLTESYYDMFECLKKISVIEFDFSNEEIELMNRTFKLLVGKKRHERNTLQLMIQKELSIGDRLNRWR